MEVGSCTSDSWNSIWSVVNVGWCWSAKHLLDERSYTQLFRIWFVPWKLGLTHQAPHWWKITPSVWNVICTGNAEWCWPVKHALDKRSHPNCSGYDLYHEKWYWYVRHLVDRRSHPMLRIWFTLQVQSGVDLSNTSLTKDHTLRLAQDMICIINAKWRWHESDAGFSAQGMSNIPPLLVCVHLRLECTN